MRFSRIRMCGHEHGQSSFFAHSSFVIPEVCPSTFVFNSSAIYANHANREHAAILSLKVDKAEILEIIGASKKIVLPHHCIACLRVDAMIVASFL